MARRNFPCPSPEPGEWVKGKVIGTGSFGTVHLAMSKSTGGLFVVKCAESVAGFESLENEAEILQSLNSPYIIQCVGKDLSNRANGKRKLTLFMEYMTGGNLSDVANKFGGVLHERVIRLYTREILKGLKYLHGNGIVHCDLKCKNVLLGSAGDVKLADFGCARSLLNDLNQSTKRNSSKAWGSIGGTPLWMAPEVLRNEALDFASDIWSLGCTVIEMATGKPPWSDKVSSPMAAVLMIACGEEKPQFPSNFSQEGLDFLGNCFNRDLKRRSTAKELLNHPFVLRNSAEKDSMKEQDASSPSSILDIGVYEEDYESDDSDCFSGNEIQTGIPFITGCANHRKISELQQADFELVSTENWVTVRSG